MNEPHDEAVLLGIVQDALWAAYQRGVVRDEGLFLVEAVAAEVERRRQADPWLSRGWPTARTPHADEPESFYLGDTGIRCTVDPTLPPDTMRLIDGPTGRVLASLRRTPRGDGYIEWTE